MLKRNNGHHQIRRLLVVQSSFVMNILKQSTEFISNAMESRKPAQHQYASDIRWADKIAKLMDKSYKQFGIKKDDIRQTYYK